MPSSSVVLLCLCRRGGFAQIEPFQNDANIISVKSRGTKMVFVLAQTNVVNKVASHSVSNTVFLHVLSFQYLYKKPL